MATWDKDHNEYLPTGAGKRVIAWFHDESVFYAHDRRKKGWYHKDGSAKPYAKGEGASLMVADFVSADFGWLSSLDGKNQHDDYSNQEKTGMDISQMKTLLRKQTKPSTSFRNIIPISNICSCMTMQLLTSNKPTMLYPLERCQKIFPNLGQIGVSKYLNAIRLLEKLFTVLMDQLKRLKY
jgi:hypothetical protein